MAHTVLIVDDYPDALELLDLTLGIAGYKTVRATNGVEAVRAAERQPVDIVIMDIFLPQMDGIAASHRIRALPGLERLPIIGYTARTGVLEEDVSVFDVVLRKPCLPDVLLGTLSDLLCKDCAAGC